VNEPIDRATATHLVFEPTGEIGEYRPTVEEFMDSCRWFIDDCLECLMQNAGLERRPYIMRAEMRGDEVFQGECVLFNPPTDRATDPGVIVDGIIFRDFTIMDERGFVTALRPQDEMRSIEIGSVLTIDVSQERFVV
jgi:hypothetical protein